MTRRSLVTLLLGFVPAVAFGWVVFPGLLFVEAAQPLQFSHQTHTAEAVGLACDDCHGFRADGSFVGIPPLARCAECHAEPIGESADEKRLVAEYVGPNREIPWLVYARQPYNVMFPHAPHVRRAALACSDCHGAHGSTAKLRPHQTGRISGYSRDVSGPAPRDPEGGAPPRMRMADCESCHARRQAGATTCLECHR
jgi:hypothetical protein